MHSSLPCYPRTSRRKVSSRHGQEIFQLLDQRLLIGKGEHAPIVHTHLEDKVRYGDLGFSIQREGKTSSKHLLWQLLNHNWHKDLKCRVLTEYVKGALWRQWGRAGLPKVLTCRRSQTKNTQRRDVHSASPTMLYKGLWSYPGNLDCHQRLLDNKEATPSWSFNLPCRSVKKVEGEKLRGYGGGLGKRQVQRAGTWSP